MGRPSKISFELVAETAERLKSEGKPFSMAAVQKVIGGSLSTVSGHYQNWRNINNIFNSSQQTPSPPLVLSTAFDKALEQRCAEMRIDFDDKLNEKQSDLDLLRENLQLLETENTELIRDATEARENAVMLMGENGELRARISSLEHEKIELLRINAESLNICLKSADVTKAIMDGLSSLEPTLVESVKEAVTFSLGELAGKLELYGKTISTKSPRSKSVKSAGDEIKATSKKSGVPVST
jgi:hypothetical protein